MRGTILLFAFIALLGTGYAAPVDNLRQFITDFRDQMPCGLPEYNLPALAPFLLDILEVNNTGLFLKVDDLRLDGLNKFEINELSVAVLVFRLGFKFTFDELHLVTKYVTDIDLGSINIEGIGIAPKIFGEGDIDFALRNLSIKGTLQLEFHPVEQYAMVKNLQLGLDLDEVRSRITGLFGSKILNDFMNDLLESAIMTFAKDMQVFVSQTAENLVIPLANSLLVNITLQDLLAWINGSGTPGPTKPPCIAPDLSFLFGRR